MIIYHPLENKGLSWVGSIEGALKKFMQAKRFDSNSLRNKLNVLFRVVRVTGEFHAMDRRADSHFNLPFPDDTFQM